MNSLRDDPALRALLDELHARSDAEVPLIEDYYRAGAPRPTGFEEPESAGRSFWRDKFVALDRDKAELCYSLCRLAGAATIIEAGTSFGVSTLYLAAAIRDTAASEAAAGGSGPRRVVTCDNEPAKVAVARTHFERAGLATFVEIRLGDIRDSLRDLHEPVDVLLLDIWAPIAGDVLALVAPHLRVGGLVVADNTRARRDLYGGLFEILDDPLHGFTTQTLPFDGGLEVAVKTG